MSAERRDLNDAVRTDNFEAMLIFD